MNMQIKTAAFELKREPDQDGVFEGYASVFDVVDLGMDTVARGAFAKSLAARKPKMLWQHDISQPIGVWDSVIEDERGLLVKGRLLKDVRQGAEAIALLKAGAIDGLSIGYRTVEAVPEAGGRVRKLIEIELHEISIVTNPMLPIATVASIKSDDGAFSPKLMEAALRDACGLSIVEAKAFMARGFKGLRNPRDAGDEALIAQIGQLERTMRHV
jgi:HK97 family phage prohead protease